MPSEVATTNQPTGSLEGTVFRFQNDAERQDALAKAFDYRGDTTLELADGSTVEGFVSNYEPTATPPRITLFVKGADAPKLIPYADIAGIIFSGKDPATGKSWHDWSAKKEHERAEEKERLRLEAEKLGHL